MEISRELIVLFCVGTYMLLSIVVGLWAIRRTRSAQDFFIAGRSLGPLVVSMAVFSSTLSGFGFVGGPGLVYATGMSSIWMVCVSALGYAIAFYTVAKSVRMISELRDTLSLPDILADRFGSSTVRLLTAITILLGVLGYLATQILAMALVLQSILNEVPAFAGINLVICAVISLSVLVFYSYTGGIVASVYTDLIQGLVMIIAGILIVLAAVHVFEGGMAQASQVIFNNDAEAIMPFGTMGMVVCLSWFFMFGFGLAGQPHVITKFMMNRNVKDTRIILPITLFGYVMAAMLWISIGVVMRAAVIGGLADPLAKADMAAPIFLGLFANPWLAGVVFAGLFAAIMSTADAFLNIGAAAIIHDIPKALRGKALQHELKWARLATIGLSILAAIFALYSHYVGGQLIAILGAFGWGMFAAALVPLVVLGLNWKGATKAGAIAAIAVSIVINIGIQLLSLKLPFAMAGGFVAMLASLITFISVSLFTTGPNVPEDISRVMDI
ncbi:MAG: sodium:solute symporter family transporter [bacterium]